jgi:hypothetical protein
MTIFAIHILFLLLDSAAVVSARPSLLRMAPLHAEKNSISITPHSEFGQSRNRQDSPA